MPPTDTKTCANCAFFVTVEPAHDNPDLRVLADGLGECRGGVPQIDWSTGGHSAAFPTTHRHNWCGRWVDRASWDRTRTYGST